MILTNNYMYIIFIDKWNIVTRLPRNIIFAGVALIKNKIYVAGGFWRGSLSRVDCYNIDTNTWSEVKNMNIARDAHILININEKLYAIGGNSEFNDNFEVYDPDKDLWTLFQQKVDTDMICGLTCLVTKTFLNINH